MVINMIDLHAHILPYVDDGARNMSEALAMARIAVQSGITALVATPHCENGGAEEIREAYRGLRDELEEEGIPLKLLLGMEIFGTAEKSATTYHR